MNKSIQMKFYNKLRQTNPVLAKSKEGRSMIMSQAVYVTKIDTTDDIETLLNLMKG